MKTVLVTGTFLEGVTYHGCSRFERTKKWLNYYRQPQVREALGFDQIICTDNASPLELLKQLDVLVIDKDQGGPEPVIIHNGNPEVTIYRHEKRLAKEKPEVAFGADYPFVWRQLWDLKNFVVNGVADKFLRIDNDAYILTNKLAHFLRDQNSGFIALSSDTHGMPEDAIMVLNKNSFPNLIGFCGGPDDQDFMKYHGKIFEKVLPLTGVAKHFVGSRYGEHNPVPPQALDMDFYCQCRLATEMIFQNEKA